MAVNFRRTVIVAPREVVSLCWRGDTLVDWVAGGVTYALDGTVTDPHIGWAYRFDAATQSPSGRYAVIFERLGTKGLLLDNGECLREINRSFYHAEAYEYPVALFTLPDGREVLAHCPEEYCRIEIDEIATGERLTHSTARKPEDFFHSRLSASSDGRWLLSAGWIWHPFNAAGVFDVAKALSDPESLDQSRSPRLHESAEVNSAVFADNQSIILASAPDADDFNDEEHIGLKPGTLGRFDLDREALVDQVSVSETVGTMLPLSPEQVIGLYEHPKVIDLRTGSVIHRWPDLPTGKQNSSILWHHESPPPIALDPGRRRFAVAAGKQITVIEVE